jgi:hypothetical protein
MATTYTAAQLQGAGVLNSEMLYNNGEFNAIKMSINLPMITPADRKHSGIGQCGLIIETINLGANPIVKDRPFQLPFGKNPTVNYMDAGYSESEEEEGVFTLKKNIIADEGAYGFYPQPPLLFGFEQTITFESLGIQHNLSKIPGSVCGPGPEESVPFERVYLPQKFEGRKIAAFTFTNDNTNNEAGIMKTFYWYPSNDLFPYGFLEGEEFFAGSVRFRGVGDFDLTTANIPLVEG